jgi:mevalonate kinase
MRNLVGGLRFELAQAAALEGAGEGSGADRQIRRRDSWMLAMQQDIGERRPLSENAVVLLAASIGALDEVVRAGGKAGTTEGAETIQKLIADVKATVPDAMEEIDRSLDLTDEVKDKLEVAINRHFEQ